LYEEWRAGGNLFSENRSGGRVLTGDFEADLGVGRVW